MCLICFGVISLSSSDTLDGEKNGSDERSDKRSMGSLLTGSMSESMQAAQEKTH